MKLLLDRVLDDGRIVVVNCSDNAIPKGTEFTALYAQKSDYSDERSHPKTVGEVVAVRLRISSIEHYRQFVEAIPKSHNAAVKLEGSGLDEVIAQLRGNQKPIQILLETTQ